MARTGARQVGWEPCPAMVQSREQPRMSQEVRASSLGLEGGRGSAVWWMKGRGALAAEGS